MELKCKIPRTIQISSIFSFHVSFATTKLVFSAGVTRHAWPNREAVPYQNGRVFGKVSYILRLYLIMKRCAYAKVNHQSPKICKICCQNKEGVKGCLKLSQNKILVCDDFPSDINMAQLCPLKVIAIMASIHFHTLKSYVWRRT